MYYSFNDYLKEKYSCKVYRLPLNANLICPNRINGAGCIYCDDKGSGPEFYPEHIKSIPERFIPKNFLLQRETQKNFMYIFKVIQIHSEALKH